MWIQRRGVGVAAAALLFSAAGAFAQTAFPSQPIKVIVGYAPGGALDTVTRIVAQGMAESLGQPVAVDNKPGASGLIATEFVKQAPPDGYTVLFVPSTFVVNPIMMAKAPYDPARDFTPVSNLATMAEVLVTAQDSRINSVRDLVALAKADPGKMSYASTGVGGPAHLSGELLQTQTGIQTIHVPFKGNAPAVTEVMAGRVSYMFNPTTGLKEFVQAKKLRPIAVTGVNHRLPEFPEVPTMAEAGFPGFEDVGIWFGVVAPAKTPPAIVARLNAAIQDALSKPAALERMKSVGAVPTAGTPKEFEDFLARDLVRWTGLIKAAGITMPN